MSVGPNMGAYFNDTAANSFFTNMLREDYRPGVIETLNNVNFLWNWLPRGAVHVEGKHWVYGVHSGRSNGSSAIGPGGHLPDPDRQRYSRWRGPMRHHYGRIQFDTIGVQASQSGVASFMQMLDGEVRGIAEDMTRQQNRMLHNDGSGRLAEINDNDAATATHSVRLPQIPESPGSMPGMPPTYFLAAGMRVATVNSATDALVEQVTIVSVDSDTDVTFSAAFNGVVGHWIISNTQDSGTTSVVSTGYKREPMGLAGIFSDANPLAYDDEDAYDSNFTTTSFQNVDATMVENGFARANVLDNAGTLRPPYESLLQTGLTRARKTNNANVSIFLSSLELQDAHGALLLQDRRFMNTMQLSGGWVAIDFAGIPWFGDRDCFPNRTYYVDPMTLQVLELAPYDWEERDGMFKRLENHDYFQAWFSGHWNLACTIRNKLTILTDLSEAVAA